MTGQNAGILVPLFDEYQVDDLKASCQRTLVESCTDDIHIDTILERLLMASTYNMAQLRIKCLNLASRAETSKLKSHQMMHDLPPDLIIELWKEIADNRDTKIKAFRTLCELLPDEIKNMKISDCYRNSYKLTYKASIMKYQASDPDELSKIISAIKLAIANELDSTLNILLALCATGLHCSGPECFFLLAKFDLPDYIKKRLTSILMETNYDT